MPSNSEPGFSLVNVGALAEPANTLITKISDLIEGFFAPHQIRRVAEAKADAALVEAKSEIQITALHKRAVRRWIEEEARRQKNMEDIAVNALPLLEETANPTAVDDDWLIHFFDQCRSVNSQQMQTLWSRALAGEANSPGSFSKRTVTALAGLDASEAKWFTHLCSYAAQVNNDTVPLVFDTTSEVYSRGQVTFVTLSDLESIGLIRHSIVGSIQMEGLPKTVRVQYYGKRCQLTMPKNSNNELNVGSVLLTRIGREFAPICGSRPVEGFWEFLRARWKAHSPT